jgi:tetratricopeptide (TPR) repeat protein
LKAVEHYSRAIDLIPDATLLSNRAAAYLGLLDFNAARQDASRVLWSDPRCSRCYLQRARACKGLNLFADALCDYREVLKTPGSADLDSIFQEIVQCQVALNRQKEAKTEALLTPIVVYARSNTYQACSEREGEVQLSEGEVQLSEVQLSEDAQRCLALFASVERREQLVLLQSMSGCSARPNSVWSSFEKSDFSCSTTHDVTEPMCEDPRSPRIDSSEASLSFTDLADFELCTVLSQLDGKSLARCEQVCQGLRRACANDLLWERLVLTEFRLVASVDFLLPGRHQWQHVYKHLAGRRARWASLEEVRPDLCTEAFAFLSRLREGDWPDNTACYAWEHRGNIGEQRSSPPVWYRYEELGGYWEWTTDLVNWMRCSTTIVVGGAYHNHTPLQVNLQIIQFLSSGPPPLCTRLDIHLGCPEQVVRPQESRDLDLRRITDAMDAAMAYQARFDG